jgi:ATP-binding cassette subfamily B protein
MTLLIWSWSSTFAVSYIPLGFPGWVTAVKPSLTDLDKMFTLMEKRARSCRRPGAQLMEIDTSLMTRFENVSFAYEARPDSAHNLSFEVPPGKTVAVVGSSGFSKSTLALLYHVL